MTSHTPNANSESNKKAQIRRCFSKRDRKISLDEDLASVANKGYSLDKQEKLECIMIEADYLIKG